MPKTILREAMDTSRGAKSLFNPRNVPNFN